MSTTTDLLDRLEGQLAQGQGLPIEVLRSTRPEQVVAIDVLRDVSSWLATDETARNLAAYLSAKLEFHLLGLGAR